MVGGHTMANGNGKSRLEELLAKQAKLESAIKAEQEKVEAEKVVAAIANEIGGSIVKIAVKAKVELKALNGKYLALTVDDDGKLSVTVATKVNGKATSNGNGHNGNGNGHEYQLKDGRKFDRLVDAIEQLQGKPCTLKHDGKSYKDGKPILRYDRLTKDLQAAVTMLDKPVATTPAVDAAK